MIHLVTSADEAYAPGLLITVISTLRSLSASEEVTFHILNGGLALDSIKQLRLLSAKTHQRSSLIFHQIREENFLLWKPRPKGPIMAYARLLLGSLVEASKIIYLDSDVIVLGDLVELWNTPMNGNVMMACRGGESATLRDDAPWSLLPGEEEFPYFNSGVILLDLDAWRTQKIEEQVIELVAESAVVYRFYDQTILNYLLRYQTGILPMTWNWQGRITTIDQATSINIIHFIMPKKPWFWWCGDLRFNLWRSLYTNSIGSPLKLFLKNNAFSGLFFGNFEIVIRRYPWLRAIYVRLLIILSAWKKNNVTSQITKHYYTEGLGGRSGDVEFKKNQPALNILQRRMKL